MAKNGDGEVLIEWLRSKEKPRRSLSHASAKPRAATVASGSRRKSVELASVVLFIKITKTAIRFKNPNYSQIYVTTQKSSKIKVAPNLKFYNFAFITTP